jgi:hypothetical protein
MRKLKEVIMSKTFKLRVVNTKRLKANIILYLFHRLRLNHFNWLYSFNFFFLLSWRLCCNFRCRINLFFLYWRIIMDQGFIFARTHLNC